MQTTPPSVGNSVKLYDLGSPLNNIAYQSNFINLPSVEPSLGLPSGYTLTEANSTYYFPVFGISTSYQNSRKFTGQDSLIFRNKNLGINNTNPQYNIDVGGTFHALSAYINVLSANYFVPASGSKQLVFTYPNGIYFNGKNYFNGNTYITNLSANSIFTNSICAQNVLYRNIVTTYLFLTGAVITNDMIVGANLTATNIFASNKISTPFLSANSVVTNVLSAVSATVFSTVSAGGDIYANKIYGKIKIDETGGLYYNSSNQLSYSNNVSYYFAVRPSDTYSTDDVSIPRTTSGPWDSPNQIEDANVSRPYFKNIGSVFSYITQNGLFGNNVFVYVDEDLIVGEQKPNSYYPTDYSGGYSGCTFTGNISARYYSTEWLGSRYPSLTAAGIKGGDFIWNLDTSKDKNGTYSYWNVPPLNFNNIYIQGRYEIGSLTRGDGYKYYSTSRPYTYGGKKLTHRTWICLNSSLSTGTFTGTTSADWKTSYVKAPVYARPVSFNASNLNNLYIKNICFEFESNAQDSSALAFYNGNNTLTNVTVALYGSAIYSYGALDINSENATVNVIGENLIDPYYLNSSTWNTWNVWSNGEYSDPAYFPGYGLAIIGRQNSNNPTIINYGLYSKDTGFINLRNGGKFLMYDKNATTRNVGRNSYQESSIILDGYFNANNFYYIDNRSYLYACDNIFINSNFTVQSKNVLISSNYVPYLSSDRLNPINFNFVTFAGSFANFIPNSTGVANWTFHATDYYAPASYNSFFCVNNGAYDPNHIYTSSNTVNLSGGINTLGYINYMKPSTYNDYNTMTFVNYTGLINYSNLGIFNLNSPAPGNYNYTLVYYTSSKR
jgi:hypothetical protein